MIYRRSLSAVTACAFLDEAIHYRYALAALHLAYLHSLKTKPPPAAVDRNHDSHFSSGSHLHFHSDSDEDDGSASESLHHHSDTTPIPLHQYGHFAYGDHEMPGLGFILQLGSVVVVAAAAGPSLAPSSSKPPPPPPSPPRSSPWEFLNPFETFESYPVYTPSRDSREVREEEGIPDLEDEDFEHEVVKEVHEDKAFVDERAGGSYSKAVEENENEKAADSEPIHQSRPSTSTRMTWLSMSDSDIVKEIQVQFERASESGNELAKLLEVGKLPTTNAAIEIADHAILDVEGDISSLPRNISSTLQKLYLWEKKLFEEVKKEEKIRVLHERKSRKLKQLDEKGAESHKVDMTRKLVISLSSKIRIAIQLVDKVSEKINKLRDEELGQLNELIQG
ncbi:hypothetical protein HAX54_032349 [Datura stramonium]|uniref:DUF632 domain-containing protein n=1 Tax=Datura stramonium TaxID=4076 RepID=A0ABS8VAG5_DATST|nr:hypothetical protein [Datura stramonium]